MTDIQMDNTKRGDTEELRKSNNQRLAALRGVQGLDALLIGAKLDCFINFFLSDQDDIHSVEEAKAKWENVVQNHFANVISGVEVEVRKAILTQGVETVQNGH